MSLTNKHLFLLVLFLQAALARRRTADMYDRFESHSDAIDHFCTNIGHDLNLELNDLLTFNDSLDESTHSVETEDYVEKLNTIATYIECNVRFNDFMPLDSDELKYMCFAHLLPFGSGNECLALVTGVGNSKKSKSDAKQKAAKNTLELFNKIRHTSRPFL